MLCMYKNSLHKSNISLSFLHMEHVCCRPSLLAALQPMMLFLRHVLQRPCMLRIHSCTGFKRYASALPEVRIYWCYICCLFSSFVTVWFYLFFCILYVIMSVTVSDSCLHDLLPQRRDSEILSRLQRHTVYPIPRTKTNKYRSSIHYALAKYQ